LDYKLEVKNEATEKEKEKEALGDVSKMSQN